MLKEMKAYAAVAYDEVELRQQRRRMKGRWDSEIKMWFVRYGLILGTELEGRLMAQ